jgi:hypothetical protein
MPHCVFDNNYYENSTVIFSYSYPVISCGRCSRYSHQTTDTMIRVSKSGYGKSFLSFPNRPYWLWGPTRLLFSWRRGSLPAETSCCWLPPSSAELRSQQRHTAFVPHGTGLTSRICNKIHCWQLQESSTLRNNVYKHSVTATEYKNASQWRYENLLILFREITAHCCDENTKHINTFGGYKSKLLIVKSRDSYSNLSVFNGQGNDKYLPVK